MTRVEGRASLCTDLSPLGLESRLRARLHSWPLSRRKLERILKLWTVRVKFHRDFIPEVKGRELQSADKNREALPRFQSTPCQHMVERGSCVISTSQLSTISPHRPNNGSGNGVMKLGISLSKVLLHQHYSFTLCKCDTGESITTQ